MAIQYCNNLQEIIKNQEQTEILSYLNERKISKYIIKEFDLGYNNNKFIFPIRNINKKITGFCERQINDTAKPKYKNSDGSDIFDKGNNLYVVEKINDKCEHLIICEGYIDVLSAFKKSFNDTVCFIAIMGTAFTEKHIYVIKHLPRKHKIKETSIMYDNDDSGKRATEATIKIMVKNGVYPSVIAYSTHDITIETKDGKDIDDILNNTNGTGNLKKLIDGKINFLNYIYDSTSSDSHKLCNDIISLISNRTKKKEYAIQLCRKSRKETYDKREEMSYHYKNIIFYNANDTKKYFLDEKQYCSINLPKYFRFVDVMEWAKKEVLALDKSATQWYTEYKKIDKSNYTLWTNKDGKYSWRKMQIINPLLYVKLVNTIAEKKHWEQIQEYFKNKPTNIKCCSLPVNDIDQFENNTARQRIEWWGSAEQDSIKQSMRYKYLVHTDIVDCYGSIYTHSIEWVLDGKTESKQNINSDTPHRLGKKLIHYFNVYHMVKQMEFHKAVC